MSSATCWLIDSLKTESNVTKEPGKILPECFFSLEKVIPCMKSNILFWCCTIRKALPTYFYLNLNTLKLNKV